MFIGVVEIFPLKKTRLGHVASCGPTLTLLIWGALLERLRAVFVIVAQRKEDTYLQFPARIY
jgi:hypothetical protein